MDVATTTPSLPPPMHGYVFLRHMRSAHTHETFLARVDGNSHDKDDDGCSGGNDDAVTTTVTRSADNAAPRLVVVRVYALAYVRRDAATRHALEREALVSRVAHHRHLAARRRAFVTTTHDVYTVEDYYARGDLYELLTRPCRSDADDNNNDNSSNGDDDVAPLPPLPRLLLELLLALAHLHEHCHIAHRNVKLETIYLDEAGHVRLGGLGQCAVLADATSAPDKIAARRLPPQASLSSRPQALLQVCCGSRHYAAPEVVCGMAYDGALVDVWAAGVVFFALLTGCFPFDGADDAACTTHDDVDVDVQARLARVRVRYDFDAAMHTHADALAQHDVRACDLLRNLLRVDPAARYTAREALEHAYLQDT